MSEAGAEPGPETEPSDWQTHQKAQVALQLANAIDRIAALAREHGFSAVSIMLDMARDLAGTEHAGADKLSRTAAE